MLRDHWQAPGVAFMVKDHVWLIVVNPHELASYTFGLGPAEM